MFVCFRKFRRIVPDDALMLKCRKGLKQECVEDTVVRNSLKLVSLKHDSFLQKLQR